MLRILAEVGIVEIGQRALWRDREGQSALGSWGKRSLREEV